MSTYQLHGPGPIFKQLARCLAEPIATGKTAIGDLLPTEQELCQRFGVSRHTVRGALATLRSMGLIESRQGIGSVVVRATPVSVFSEGFSSVDELIQTGRSAPLRAHSITEIITDEKLAGELRVRSGQSFLKIEGLRPAGKRRQAFFAAYVEVYVNSIYSGVRTVLPDLETSIAEAIDKLYQVSIERIDQEIEVTKLSAPMAKALELPPKTPALRIQRWYYSSNQQVFEIAISYYPIGRFVYRSVIRRRAG